MNQLNRIKIMAESKKNPLVENEEQIQKFWADNKIFEKTLTATKGGEVFSFYDGPPFATGAPHYGHLVASIMKDVVPRYQTMKGKYVERRWGWDCHGLPIENLIEQELGLANRQDIEAMGVSEFNRSCRISVLRFANIWKKTIPRLGRWVNMDDDYKTMEPWYMESIWWVFKELWDKDLVYEGHKAMHICPRCETTLSNFEVTQGYKNIKDISATAKFELVDEPGTFVLAWTTTPWTLIGNVALAIGNEIDYVLIHKNTKTQKQESDPKPRKTSEKSERYILAKELVEKVFKDQEYEVIEEFKGKKLVGKKYKPLFDYYLDKDINHKENLYTIVSADFVSTIDGVGIVHIAPAFGEEDLVLGEEKNLPLIQHVDESGRFKEEVKDFTGLEVKPKEDHQKTDVEIIKNLAEKGLLFAKEKYEHSYPHCWRCDTPLLNYATSSWFVKVTEIKKDLIKNNQKVNWVPAHLKDGRFGRWLEDARDWAISRSRYWGTPLPIWRCKCGELKVIGSAEELDQEKIDNVNIYTIRHGESEKNTKHVFDNTADKYPLTEKGLQQAKRAGKKLQDYKIEVIISSEVLRCRQTAEEIGRILGVKVECDARLNEVAPGQGQDQTDNSNYARKIIEQWMTKQDEGVLGSESVCQVRRRVYEVFKDVQKNYAGKNVLLVSHGDVIRILEGKLLGLPDAEVFVKLKMPENTDLKKLTEKTVDIHKDMVDVIELKCHQCGQNMKRVPEVLDCWFESGSMPYAQMHYPFESKDRFKESFPADFIAEGVDQTRGWFYTLMILATALFDQPAFKNVIANGIVLAGDGNKMSKRLKNYPEPDLIMDKYGADALRIYLLSSPVMTAENLNFSEPGVKEAFQKVVMLSNNVLNFYKLYADDKIKADEKSTNILDQWLIAKLHEFNSEMTQELENYQLAKAVRPIQQFVDEFSTWWLRRSRDRFKSDNEKDKQQALSTFKSTLLEMAKVMAPFTPFLAEHIYQEIGGRLESVHLEKWPAYVKATARQAKVIEQMTQVRKIVELGLAERAKLGIKIRQPLAALKLKVKSAKLKVNEDLFYLLQDELNVKKIILSDEIEGDLEFDTNITEELKVAGMLRELIRTINGLRKNQGLTIGDRINVLWQSEGEIIKKLFADNRLVAELKDSVLTNEFKEAGNQSEAVTINGEEIKLTIEKL